MKIDKEYNTLLLERIDGLISQNRNTYKIDLHLHTCYSSDGIQTVAQAILKAREKKFDIISITDHDTIDAYEEVIRERLYEDQTIPIIIPGVEFTVSYPSYEGRCHVLKYFFNTDDSRFISNLEQNQTAYRNRVGIWFQRVKENNVLQYFMKKYKIACSGKAYFDFLVTRPVKTPEYPTLMEYLYSLLGEKGVCVWDVYEKAIEMNDEDICELRKEKKRIALYRFYEKYRDQDISHNYRKLRPILAPVGIDDNDYPGYKSSGSLSVNEFGQVSIQELNNSGINILAHPDQNKLDCIDSLVDVLHGLELNHRSDEAANKAVFEKGRSISLSITKGSDKHVDTNELYENTHFYNISYSELQLLAMRARESLYKL